MRKLMLTTTIVCGACFFAAPVKAAPSITGNISFDGSDTYDTTTHTVTFVGLQNAAVDTGSLSNIGVCSACATFKDLTYIPFSPVTSEIAVTNNGSTFSYDLNSLTQITENASFLDISGTGVMHETGFADTNGDFFFSTQGPQGPTVTFSATNIPTPEPASLALLGFGLLGLGMVKYRHKV